MKNSQTTGTKFKRLGLLALFVTFSISQAYAQINSIEPSNWWAGMKNSKLQLMVYGDELAGANVTSSNDSVSVLSAKSLDNPNFLFIDLEMGDDLEPGIIELNFILKNNRTVVKEYEFKRRQEASESRVGFSSKDVIYLLTPDRFANGDDANDQVDSLYEGVDRKKPGGRHGGDLIGITENLDYIESLGITQLWLNPLQENNQEEYSYHGYSISDLYKIDARLGGNDALFKLAEQAAARGIGLIMDTVPNHIGLNHWWMKDLPARDWVNNTGEYMETTHRRETIQDPHAADIDKVNFNDGWFVPTMPDLNQRNEYLATYIIQNNIWWTESSGLSGLRVDTLPYGDRDFTAKFSRAILNEYPKLNIVGEEWVVNPAIVSYWQRGKKNLDGFDAHMPSLMDFPLQEAMILALTEEEAWNNGLILLYQTLANDFQYPDPYNLVVIADNHDMSRIYSQLDDNVDLYKIALTFLMTTRGIPQLFYGTEILMNNPGTEDHGIIRSDFPGGWANDSVNAFTGQGLSARELDAQDFVKRLLNWRKQSAVIHHGKLKHFVPEEGTYVYFRILEDDVVMVAINKNDQDITLDTSRFIEVLKGKKSATDVLSNKSQKLKEHIMLPAKTAMIYEIK